MPETVAVSRSLGRSADEKVRSNESFLSRLFSADVVKFIQESLQIVEADGQGLGFSFSIASSINLGEIGNYILGAAEQFFVEVINESVSFLENLRRVLGVPVESDLVRVIDELQVLLRSLIWYKDLIKIRNYGFQIHEKLSPTRSFAKQVDELVSFLEEKIADILVVDIELVKSIVEAISVRSSEAFSTVVLQTSSRVINENLSIRELASGLAYQIAQIVFNLSIRPILRFTIWLNKDSS